MNWERFLVIVDKSEIIFVRFYLKSEASSRFSSLRSRLPDLADTGCFLALNLDTSSVVLKAAGKGGATCPGTMLDFSVKQTAKESSCVEGENTFKFVMKELGFMLLYSPWSWCVN